jgi:hypothetical protein
MFYGHQLDDLTLISIRVICGLPGKYLVSQMRIHENL